MVILR